MESVSNYLSTFFKKTNTECEEMLDKEMTLTNKLRSDANAGNPNKAWAQRRKYLKSTKVVPIDPKTPIRDDCVRFVCISDTHAVLEKHRNLEIPDGDILLHAGDLTMYGEPDEVHLVNDYLGTLPHKHKVLIAGNHDNTFDLEFIRKKRSTHIWSLNNDNYDSRLKAYNVTSVPELMTNCIYLQDSAVEIFGIKIYGAPWTIGRGSWGFQRPAGPGLMDKWNKIPNDTDVLITHCPPCGYGDHVISLGSVVMKLAGQRNYNDHVGCVDLLNTVNSRVKPQYHIFGHIHEGYGMYTDGTTTYINASTCTRIYKSTNPPIVFDIPLPEGHSKDEMCVRSKPDENDFMVDSDSEESKTDSAEAQKDCDKEDLFDQLSYRPDGTTNYEKLTMDHQVVMDNKTDVGDVDDGLGDGDVVVDNENCDKKISEVTTSEVLGDDDVVVDNENCDKKIPDVTTSEAVDDSMNELILADKPDHRVYDSDTSTESVDCELFDKMTPFGF